MTPSGLYALGACLLALVATGSAIKCYDCITANPEHLECVDPFEMGSQGNTDQYITNCKNADDREHEVCRKTTTIQYAVRADAGDTQEVGRTVSRYCGGPKAEIGCELIYGDATSTYDCVCDEDGCNASASILANISTMAIAMFGIALLRKLLTL